jgi:hypothetical protein
MPNQKSNRQPGSRALEAIAEAARRSREGANAGSSEPSPAHGSPHRPGPASDVPVDLRSPAWASSDRRREMRRVTPVIVAALLLVLVTATLAVFEVTRGGSRAAPRSLTIRTSTARPALAPSSIPPTPLSHSTLPSASTAPTSSIGGSDPVLSSLTPSSGAAGQSVVISGANFPSGDGEIIARFGGRMASIRCSDQTSCSVTVPVLAGSPSVITVTVTTVVGTSNALNFTYG